MEFDAEMLRVDPRGRSLGGGDYCCLGCTLPLQWLMQNNAECCFHFLYIKWKSSSNFFQLMKTDIDVSLSEKQSGIMWTLEKWEYLSHGPLRSSVVFPNAILSSCPFPFVSLLNLPWFCWVFTLQCAEKRWPLLLPILRVDWSKSVWVVSVP